MKQNLKVIFISFLLHFSIQPLLHSAQSATFSVETSATEQYPRNNTLDAAITGTNSGWQISAKVPFSIIFAQTITIIDNFQSNNVTGHPYRDTILYDVNNTIILNNPIDTFGQRQRTLALSPGNYSFAPAIDPGGIGSIADYSQVTYANPITQTASLRSVTKSLQSPDSGGTFYFDYAPWDPDGHGQLIPQYPGGVLQTGTCSNQIISNNNGSVSLSFVNRGYTYCNGQWSSGNGLGAGWSVQAAFPDLRSPPHLSPSGGINVSTDQPLLSWGPGYSNPDPHNFTVVIASANVGINAPFFNQSMGTLSSILFPHKIIAQTDFVWKVIASNPGWNNSIETVGSFTIIPDTTPPYNVFINSMSPHFSSV